MEGTPAQSCHILHDSTSPPLCLVSTLVLTTLHPSPTVTLYHLYNSWPYLCNLLLFSCLPFSLTCLMLSNHVFLLSVEGLAMPALDCQVDLTMLNGTAGPSPRYHEDAIHFCIVPFTKHEHSADSSDIYSIYIF